MRTLTLELPTDIYKQLNNEANRLGKSAQLIVQEWVVERLVPKNPPIINNRENARQALRAAGLLAERNPARNPSPSMSLEEVNAIFAQLGGKPLSEMVIEQRGAKI